MKPDAIPIMSLLTPLAASAPPPDPGARPAASTGAFAALLGAATGAADSSPPAATPKAADPAIALEARSTVEPTAPPPAATVAPDQATERPAVPMPDARLLTDAEIGIGPEPNTPTAPTAAPAAERQPRAAPGKRLPAERARTPSRAADASVWARAGRHADPAKPAVRPELAAVTPEAAAPVATQPTDEAKRIDTPAAEAPADGGSIMVAITAATSVLGVDSVPATEVAAPVRWQAAGTAPAASLTTQAEMRASSSGATAIPQTPIDAAEILNPVAADDTASSMGTETAAPSSPQTASDRPPTLRIARGDWQPEPAAATETPARTVAPAPTATPPAPHAAPARAEPRVRTAAPRSIALTSPAIPAPPTAAPAAATDRLLRARPNTAFAAEPASAPIFTDLAQPESLRHTASPTAPTPIDTARTEWRATMIERIETVVAEAGGARETRIALSPDKLGEVALRLVETDRGIEVALDAALPEARALLAEAAPRLAEMAEARGLRLSMQPGGGEQPGGDRPPAPHRPQPEAPITNRRAASTAADTTTDQRIA